MKKYLFVLPMFLTISAATCGDDPEPTTRIDIHATKAIADWKAHGNAWHQHCSPSLVYLHPTAASTLPSHCGVDAQLYACLDGFDIWIDQDIMNTVRSNYVVEHELRHWLGGCEYGLVDGNHADSRYWYDYCGSAGCQDIRN